MSKDSFIAIIIAFIVVILVVHLAILGAMTIGYINGVGFYCVSMQSYTTVMIATLFAIIIVSVLSFLVHLTIK